MDVAMVAMGASVVMEVASVVVGRAGERPDCSGPTRR
jgi:hypothetical protein